LLLKFRKFDKGKVEILEVMFISNLIKKRMVRFIVFFFRENNVISDGQKYNFLKELVLFSV
jgi:hypothetical protein